METLELDRIIGDFPPRIRKPMKTLVGWMQKNQVTREDFTELKWAIERLTMAQAQTEERVGELAAAQQKLAQAQERTEQELHELAISQKEMGEHLTKSQQEMEQRLIESQQSLEERMTASQQAMEERMTKSFSEQLIKSQQAMEERMTASQQAMEERMTKSFSEQLIKSQQAMEERMTESFSDQLLMTQQAMTKTISDQIAALGGRWGIYNEGTFRATIQGILQHTKGLKVEHGMYGGREVDMIIRNGEHILLEITSRMHAKDIEKMYRSADDYRVKTGVEPKLMVATSYVSPLLMQKIMGLERRIDIFSYEAGD